MFKKILALALIFIIASIAWMTLGATLAQRTAKKQNEMSSAVGELWGQPHFQYAPVIRLSRWEERRDCVTNDKTKEETCTKKRVKLWDTEEPAGSDVKVKLGLEQRRKGLLWFSLYTVNFSGDYQVVNPRNENRDAELTFHFPNRMAIYDNLEVKVSGKPDAVIKQFTSGARQDHEDGATEDAGMTVRFPLKANEQVTVHYGYDSRGKDSWRYLFGNSVKAVKNFKLTMTTDFAKIDFPPNSMSPDAKRQTGSGWELTWDKKNLVSGFSIGMSMPKRINPGPLAERMSFFAPVSLLFFFAVIFIITELRGIKIHPMNYLFLAAAFFAFHLLFAYTVDHINIYLAFVISSVVSIFLVVSYLRLVAGARFALVEAGGAQFIYLVVFNCAHFFEGYTGLIVTILSIVTLFVVMQVTGKIDWEQKFNPKSSA